MEDVRTTLARIAHEHEREGSGNGEIQHLITWIGEVPPEVGQLARQALLQDFQAGLPDRIDWIALGSLAGDRAPSVAAELERLARSHPERSQWRDAVVEALARMGHRPALDLCLELLGQGFEYSGVLLANLINLDRNVGLDYGVSYFVEGLGSADEETRVMTARCVDTFLMAYQRVDPGLAVELARRVRRESPVAGRELVSALSESCNSLRPFPVYGCLGLAALQQQLDVLATEAA
jgi:hypothetical protein